MTPPANPRTTTPAVPRWILTVATRPDHRPYVLAEADAEFEEIVRSSGRPAAVGWYWRQAILSLGPSLRSRTDARPDDRGASGPTGRAFRQAGRVVRRHPWFSAGVVATLTLGATAATTVFSLAEAALLRPLPYDRPDGLVALTTFDRVRGLYDRDVSGPDYFDLVERGEAFAELSAYETAPVAYLADEGAVRVSVARVTPGLFGMLGIEPIAGRGLSSSEIGSDAPRHAILSLDVAVERFADPERALGATIVLDGESYLTVGVVARRPPLAGMDVEAWVPLPYDRTSLRRQAGVLSVVGRLGPGASLERARADLDRLGRAFEAEHPDSNQGRGFAVSPLHEALSSGVRSTLSALALAVALLLTIAVVNASGLILVRCLRREREIAIRSALGASRADVVSQLLLEGLMLGAIAAVASGGLATLIGGRLETLVPSWPSRLPDLGVGTMWLAAAVAIPAAVLASGIAVLSAKPGAALLRGATRATATRTRSWLLGGQIAATTVLIVCVTLLGRSLLQLVRVDPGFDPEDVVSVSISLPDATYPTDMETYPEWPAIHSFYERLLAEVESIGGSPRAALAWHHPLARGWLARFVREGEEHIPDGEREMVNIRSISPGYLDVVGARLLAGRAIEAADREGSERVTLVNRSLEARYFPDGSAIGSRLLFFGGHWRIVGVLDDFKSHGLAVETRPAVFPPLRQMPSEAFHVLVRRPGPPAALLAEVRDAIRRVDPAIPPDEMVSLEAALAEATEDRRFVLRLFGAFGLLAYLLALTGLAGAVAEMVECRRRELGLRRALGASAAGLYGLVLGGSLRLSATGVGAGLVLGLVLARYLEPWLYRVSAWWPGAYAAAGAVLIASGIAAATVPALRAMLADPRELLRDVDG